MHYMQLVIPNVVAIAVRTVMTRLMIIFQVSFFVCVLMTKVC